MGFAMVPDFAAGLSLRYQAFPLAVCFEFQMWSSLAAISSRVRPVTALFGSASVMASSLLLRSKSSCSLMRSQLGLFSFAALPPMRDQSPFALHLGAVHDELQRSGSQTFIHIRVYRKQGPTFLDPRA